MTASEKSSFILASLVRQNIRDMKAYSSARDEFHGEAEVFLDANENPYPTSFNRYPDPLQWAVKKKLAKIKHVNPEQIFLGNGSDEAIDLLIRAFCEPKKDSILIAEPTYGMYAVCAAVNDVNLQRTLLTPQFDLDLDAISNAVDGTTKLIFLCSPNNPSANLLSYDKIIHVLNSVSCLVVVDEAYIDFTSAKSLLKDLTDYPNLVVLQTFSKAWGLAGLRLGMCFASMEIISILNKIKYPYNVNIKTQEIALETLKLERRKNKSVREIIKQREKMAKALNKLSITENVYPSDANFLLVRVKDASRTYHELMNQGIIVRDRSNVALCNNCLRITIGTPKENKKLIQALKQF